MSLCEKSETQREREREREREIVREKVRIREREESGLAIFKALLLLNFNHYYIFREVVSITAIFFKIHLS